MTGPTATQTNNNPRNKAIKGIVEKLPEPPTPEQTENTELSSQNNNFVLLIANTPEARLFNEVIDKARSGERIPKELRKEIQKLIKDGTIPHELTNDVSTLLSKFNRNQTKIDKTIERLGKKLTEILLKKYGDALGYDKTNKIDNLFQTTNPLCDFSKRLEGCSKGDLISLYEHVKNYCSNENENFIISDIKQNLTEKLVVDYCNNDLTQEEYPLLEELLNNKGCKSEELAKSVLNYLVERQYPIEGVSEPERIWNAYKICDLLLEKRNDHDIVPNTVLKAICENHLLVETILDNDNERLHDKLHPSQKGKLLNSLVEKGSLNLEQLSERIDKLSLSNETNVTVNYSSSDKTSLKIKISIRNAKIELEADEDTLKSFFSKQKNETLYEKIKEKLYDKCYKKHLSKTINPENFLNELKDIGLLDKKSELRTTTLTASSLMTPDLQNTFRVEYFNPKQVISLLEHFKKRGLNEAVINKLCKGLSDCPNNNTKEEVLNKISEVIIINSTDIQKSIVSIHDAISNARLTPSKDFYRNIAKLIKENDKFSDFVSKNTNAEPFYNTIKQELLIMCLNEDKTFTLSNKKIIKELFEQVERNKQTKEFQERLKSAIDTFAKNILPDEYANLVNPKAENVEAFINFLARVAYKDGNPDILAILNKGKTLFERELKDFLGNLIEEQNESGENASNIIKIIEHSGLSQKYQYKLFQKLGTSLKLDAESFEQLIQQYDNFTKRFYERHPLDEIVRAQMSNHSQEDATGLFKIALEKGNLSDRRKVKIFKDSNINKYELADYLLGSSNANNGLYKTMINTIMDDIKKGNFAPGERNNIINLLSNKTIFETYFHNMNNKREAFLKRVLEKRAEEAGLNTEELSESE